MPEAAAAAAAKINLRVRESMPACNYNGTRRRSETQIGFNDRTTVMRGYPARVGLVEGVEEE